MLSCTKHVTTTHARTHAPAFLTPKDELAAPLQFKGCVLVWRNAVGRHSRRAQAGPRPS